MKKFRNLMGITLVVAGAFLLLFMWNQQPKVKKSFDDEWMLTAEQVQQGESVLRPQEETGEVVTNHYEMTFFEPMDLVIPTLDFRMEVISGDVFSEDDLRAAPVHFQMSDLPGTKHGNTAFAAHRRGSYAFFRDLDFLNPGDELLLETSTHRFVYEVSWTRVVDPYDWSVIDTTDMPALTLQTCEPKHSFGTHRLIVRAYLKGWEEHL